MAARYRTRYLLVSKRTSILTIIKVSLFFKLNLGIFSTCISVSLVCMYVSRLSDVRNKKLQTVVMGISIRSTVKFAKMGLDINMLIQICGTQRKIRAYSQSYT